MIGRIAARCVADDNQIACDKNQSIALIKIKEPTHDLFLLIAPGRKQPMLDSVIVTTVAFFVLFGCTVLVIDWIQRRAPRRHR
jgi:hypothetical protein